MRPIATQLSTSQHYLGFSDRTGATAAQICALRYPKDSPVAGGDREPAVPVPLDDPGDVGAGGRSEAQQTR
jgi:hypothetical protein